MRQFKFRQVGHGQKEDMEQSRIGTLNNPYLHYSFSKGFKDWFEKHNRYSSMEAEEITAASGNRQCRTGPGFALQPDPARRRALKELSFRLPFQATDARFIYMYILRLGFLDGHAGFVYCRLLAIYEYMIVLKIKGNKDGMTGLIDKNTPSEKEVE